MNYSIFIFNIFIYIENSGFILISKPFQNDGGVVGDNNINTSSFVTS